MDCRGADSGVTGYFYFYFDKLGDFSNRGYLVILDSSRCGLFTLFLGLFELLLALLPFSTYFNCVPTLIFYVPVCVYLLPDEQLVNSCCLLLTISKTKVTTAKIKTNAKAMFETLSLS